MSYKQKEQCKQHLITQQYSNTSFLSVFRSSGFLNAWMRTEDQKYNITATTHEKYYHDSLKHLITILPRGRIAHSESDFIN